MELQRPEGKPNAGGILITFHPDEQEKIPMCFVLEQRP
jgi:hypothetical protein